MEVGALAGMLVVLIFIRMCEMEIGKKTKLDQGDGFLMGRFVIRRRLLHQFWLSRSNTCSHLSAFIIWCLLSDPGLLFGIVSLVSPETDQSAELRPAEQQGCLSLFQSQSL